MLLVISHLPNVSSPPEDLVVVFPCTIGRSLKNMIVIDHPSVAEFHAVIELRKREFILKDLGTGSPTSVAGKQITEHAFADKLKAVIGTVQVEMLAHAEASTTTAVKVGAPAKVARKAERPRPVSAPAGGGGAFYAKVGAAFVVVAIAFGVMRSGPDKNVPPALKAGAPEDAVAQAAAEPPAPRAVQQATPQAMQSVDAGGAASRNIAGEAMPVSGAPVAAPALPDLNPTAKLADLSSSGILPYLTMTIPPAPVAVPKTPYELLTDEGPDRAVIFTVFLIIWMACILGIAKAVDPEFQPPFGIARGLAVLFASLLVVTLAKLASGVAKYNFDVQGMDGMLIGMIAFVASATYLLGTVWAISPQAARSRIGGGAVLFAFLASIFASVSHNSEAMQYSTVQRGGLNYTWRHYTAEKRPPQGLYDLLDQSLKKVTGP